MSELVSCILATRDRRHFFQQALRCFLRQTYQPADLIVIDDGDEPVEEFCSGLERVQYIRLPVPTPTGAKLNLGIERARGTILQKIDDDDYYHPDFLKTAIAHLPGAEREHTLVAWDCFLILLAGERKVRHSGHGWAAGGTLCFSRRLWERTGFRDVPSDVDYWFLADHDPNIVRVCAPEHYVLVRHGRNTWTEMDDVRTDDYVRGLPVYPKALEDLIDPRDLPFYVSLEYAAASRSYNRTYSSTIL